MSDEIIYKGMTLNEISKLPEDKQLDLACKALKDANRRLTRVTDRLENTLAELEASDRVRDHVVGNSNYHRNLLLHPYKH